MGNSSQIFLIHDNNSLHPLSPARFKRLLKQEPAERLPQYAGRRIRCARATLSLSGRKLQAINKIEYSLLPFDTDGRIDIAERERQTRLAIESAPPLLRQNGHHKQIIDARGRFAKKRYDDNFKWTPNPAVEAALVVAILNSLSC